MKTELDTQSVASSLQQRTIPRESSHHHPDSDISERISATRQALATLIEGKTLGVWREIGSERPDGIKFEAAFGAGIGISQASNDRIEAFATILRGQTLEGVAVSIRGANTQQLQPIEKSRAFPLIIRGTIAPSTIPISDYHFPLERGKPRQVTIGQLSIADIHAVALFRPSVSSEVYAPSIESLWDFRLDLLQRIVSKREFTIEEGVR